MSQADPYHVQSRIKRCAVCKIDPKGRFVYIDDEVEKLLGLSKEDLFGKPFLDFLVEEDHDVINHLMDQRNHFEIFFETTYLKLLDHQKNVIPALVVMTLNFIAGNPVNYQLILDPYPDNFPSENSTERTTAVSENDSSPYYREFLSDYLESVEKHDYNKLAQAAQLFSRVQEVVIYRIDEGGPVHLADSQPIDSANKEIPALVGRLAESGQNYCFTDQAHVKQAVESESSAPNEVIEHILLPGENSGLKGLVRFVFNPDREDQNVSEQINDIYQVVRLLNLRTQPEPMMADPQNDVSKMSPDRILDQAGVGYLWLNESGEVVTANETVQQLFGMAPVGENYRTLLAILEDQNNPGLIAEVTGILEKATENEDIIFEQQLQITGKKQFSLMVMKSAQTEHINTAAFLFIPAYLQYPGLALMEKESERLSNLIGESRNCLKQISESSEKIGHDYYNQLNHNGNIALTGLIDKTARLTEMLKFLEKSVERLKRPGLPENADFNLVIYEVQQNLARLFPNIKLSIEHNDLPKFKCWRREITLLLESMLAHSIRIMPSENCRFNITARMENDFCHVKISQEKLPGVDKDIRYKELFSSSPVKREPIENNELLGPEDIEFLIKGLGGHFKIQMNAGKDLQIDLKVPVCF